MLANLLIAPQTRHQLEALANDPPQALLITGPANLGKSTLANAWALQFAKKQDILLVEPDEKGTISIDTIRTLYQRTRSRQEGRQAVIINHAQAMGIEAQNAFLKLLEEPRAGVTFVLTAVGEDSLLPTMSSRVQHAAAQRSSPSALTAFFADATKALSPQERTQLLFVADGRPAVMASLLHDPQAFAHYKEIMQQAKQLLGASPYERLSLVTNLAKNKDDAVRLLEAMAHMLRIQLQREPSEKLIHLADGIQTCLARLGQNGNPRAQLTALFAAY